VHGSQRLFGITILLQMTFLLLLNITQLGDTQADEQVRALLRRRG
jgi:hypothetical protein